nr:MAG TPA: hypothetical protein [Caudoviricetes sp.]
MARRSPGPEASAAPATVPSHGRPSPVIPRPATGDIPVTAHPLAVRGGDDTS